MSKVVSIRLESSTYRLLRQRAQALGVTPPVAMRFIVRAALTGDPDDSSFHEGYTAGLNEFHRRLREITEE